MNAVQKGNDVGRKPADNSLDGQFTKLLPCLQDTYDDLPLLDIMIGRGAKPNTFRSSVAVYLEDGTLQAHADDHSIEQALKRAVVLVSDRVTSHNQAAKRRRTTFQRIFTNPEN